MASRKPPAHPETADEDSSDTDDTSAAEAPSAPEGTSAPEDPSTPEVTSAPDPSGGKPNRFFSWMRGLGIPRQPGWIGGVAAGLGQRLGIDPIIVRGVIVVVAVLGGPALLLYAAAWLLLPDTQDRIHAEQLGRGRFEAAMVGIGIMALLSFLPLNQGFWWAGAAFWGDLSLGASVGRALWTALLLAGIVVLIIVVARRAGTTTITPATTDDKPDTIPILLPPAEQAVEPSIIAPAPPPAPAADADADDLQAWRERQALWKQQNAEWKAQQAATQRELRQQRALEAHERALAASAERAEQRRLRRLANPRINAATSAVAFGTAILAGCVAALVASNDPSVGGHEVTVALATAAIVLGASIVVAGIFRRRSGALVFFSIVAILAMLVSAGIPRDRQLLLWGIGMPLSSDARLAVPVGPLYLTAFEEAPGGVTDVWQGSGYTELSVRESASVRIELSSASGNVTIYDREGRGRSFGEGVDGVRKVGDEWHWSATIGPDPEPANTLRLRQDSGRLVIFDENLTPIDPLAEEPTTTEGAQ